MDDEGYVYCLTNDCMPGLVKIGMTLQEPEERARELSTATGVPAPFHVQLVKKVHKPYEKEQAIHNLLSALGYRFNEKREFFTCAMGIVDLLFALIDGTDVQVSMTVAPTVAKRYAVNVVKLDDADESKVLGIDNDTDYEYST